MELDSRFKDMTVLVLACSPEKFDMIESELEIDTDLRRLLVLKAESVEQARDLNKEHLPQLIFIEDGFDQRDTVFLAQLLSKHPRPNQFFIGVAPMLRLDLYRNLNSQVQCLDFIQSDQLYNFSSMKNGLLNLLRKYKEKQDQKLQNDLVVVNSLQKAMDIEERFNLCKTTSSQIIQYFCSDYDFGVDKEMNLILCEKIFNPSYQIRKYSEIVKGVQGLDLYPLSQAGSWLDESRSPGGAEGLLITLSNYISYLLQSGEATETIVNKILERPHFLKHISIRTLKKDRLEEVIGLMGFDQEELKYA